MVTRFIIYFSVKTLLKWIYFPKKNKNQARNCHKHSRSRRTINNEVQLINTLRNMSCDRMANVWYCRLWTWSHRLVSKTSLIASPSEYRVDLRGDEILNFTVPFALVLNNTSASRTAYEVRILPFVVTASYSLSRRFAKVTY